MIPRFIGAFIASSVLVIAASMVWPKVMNRERPKLLEDVHSTVLGTQVGQDAEGMLGTVDIPSNVPSYIASVSSNVGSQALGIIQAKSEEIVTKRIVEEVIKRYETIPEDEKTAMKELICKPAQ